VGPKEGGASSLEDSVVGEFCPIPLMASRWRDSLGLRSVASWLLHFPGLLSINQEVIGGFISEFCNVQNICCAGVLEKIDWDLCNNKRDSGGFVLVEDELNFI
jgi:hypothetical protein